MDIDYKAFKLKISPIQIAKLIDHTKLNAWEEPSSITNLCNEAIEYKFFSVCVNSSYVPLVVDLLKNSEVKVCSVVGFPLGTMESKSKAYEAKQAVLNGVHEVDMVINIGRLKNKENKLVQEDIEAVVSASEDALVKVIIETCYLTDQEKIRACELCKEAGADFVKTSTGFGAYGAFPSDVKLLRKIVGSNMGIKAAGGIRTLLDAARVIIAGGSVIDPLKFRIGASAGINIVNEAKEISLIDNWIPDEIPCRLCPVHAATSKKMTQNHYSYLKNKCKKCDYIEYSKLYD